MSIAPLPLEQTFIPNLSSPLVEKDKDLGQCVNAVKTFLSKPDAEILKKLNSGLSWSKVREKGLSSRTLPELKGLDDLVAAVSNISVPFARLQAFVSKLLARSKASDVKQDQHFLNHASGQLAGANEISSRARLATQLLELIGPKSLSDPKPGHSFDESFNALYQDLGAEEMMEASVELIDFTDNLYNKFSKYLEALGESEQSSLEQIYELRDKFKVRVDNGDTVFEGYFRFLEPALKRFIFIEPEEMDLMNALFNKAGLPDLITVQQNDEQ